MTHNQKLTEHERSLMVGEYINGENSVQLSAKYGVTPAAVRKAVLKSGLQMRTNSEVKRRYSFDLNFFDEINTEEKAYWLGFISADGCIAKNRALAIALSDRDVDHLYKFLKHIKSEHPVFVSKGVAKIHIGSYELANKLEKIGLHPAKSLTVKEISISDKLKRHYWRGMFDGDGCILTTVDKSRNNKVKLSVDLVGSQAIILSFKSLCDNLTGCNPSIKPCGRAYEIRYSGNRSSKVILDYLYKDAHVYLERKMSIYLNMLKLWKPSS